jgi:hypothetical protein
MLCSESADLDVGLIVVVFASKDIASHRTSRASSSACNGSPGGNALAIGAVARLPCRAPSDTKLDSHVHEFFMFVIHHKIARCKPGTAICSSTRSVCRIRAIMRERLAWWPCTKVRQQA